MQHSSDNLPYNGECIKSNFCQRAVCKKKKTNNKNHQIPVFSKIQLVVYYQCCVLIGRATTRLYVIAYQQRKKKWRLNRVLLAKVVLSRYFRPTSWILLKQLFLSPSWPLSQQLLIQSPFGLEELLLNIPVYVRREFHHQASFINEILRIYSTALGDHSHKNFRNLQFETKT